MDNFSQITEFDRLIHEPSRLAIMAVLSACESADFTYLLQSTGLTKGNLSAHLSKLRDADYVFIQKGYKGNYPHTVASLTPYGRQAFKAYRKQFQSIAKKLQG